MIKMFIQAQNTWHMIIHATVTVVVQSLMNECIHKSFRGNAVVSGARPTVGSRSGLRRVFDDGKLQHIDGSES